MIASSKLARATMKLSDITTGTIVTRMMCGMPMELRVTEVTDALIKCGPWEFDKLTGAEVDEELGWGRQETGSYLLHDGIGKMVHIVQKGDSLDTTS